MKRFILALAVVGGFLPTAVFAYNRQPAGATLEGPLDVTIRYYNAGVNRQWFRIKEPGYDWGGGVGNFNSCVDAGLATDTYAFTGNHAVGNYGHVTNKTTLQSGTTEANCNAGAAATDEANDEYSVIPTPSGGGSSSTSDATSTRQANEGLLATSIMLTLGTGYLAFKLSGGLKNL